jgi:hypothetical protein
MAWFEENIGTNRVMDYEGVQDRKLLQHEVLMESLFSKPEFENGVRVLHFPKANLYLAGKNDAFKVNNLQGAIARLCITRGNPPAGMNNWQKKDNPRVAALAPSSHLIFDFWNNSSKDDSAWLEYCAKWREEKHNYTPGDLTAENSDDPTVWWSSQYYDSIVRIDEHLTSGVNIALGCWCTDNHCHRFLVAKDVIDLYYGFWNK